MTSFDPQKTKKLLNSDRLSDIMLAKVGRGIFVRACVRAFMCSRMHACTRGCIRVYAFFFAHIKKKYCSQNVVSNYHDSVSFFTSYSVLGLPF